VPLPQRGASEIEQCRRGQRLFGVVQEYCCAVSSTSRIFPLQHEFTGDELRAVDAPVQFVLGERSAVHDAREVAARVESLNPRFRAEIVPRSAHVLTVQEPDLTISRILSLVEDDRADLPE
jgi:pimeloyl-ACP methyl ester carboxylesterase